MVDQLQIFRLQMKLQAVNVSDLSLAKINSQKFFVSDDLDPDLHPVQAITRFFSKTFNHDPQTIVRMILFHKNYVQQKIQNLKHSN